MKLFFEVSNISEFIYNLFHLYQGSDLNTDVYELNNIKSNKTIIFKGNLTSDSISYISKSELESLYKMLNEKGFSDLPTKKFSYDMIYLNGFNFYIEYILEESEFQSSGSGLVLMSIPKISKFRIKEIYKNEENGEEFILPYIIYEGILVYNGFKFNNCEIKKTYSNHEVEILDSNLSSNIQIIFGCDTNGRYLKLHCINNSNRQDIENIIISDNTYKSLKMHQMDYALFRHIDVFNYTRLIQNPETPSIVYGFIGLKSEVSGSRRIISIGLNIIEAGLFNHFNNCKIYY